MRIRALFLILILLSSPTHAQDKTIIHNKEEAAQLLGKHLFTMDQISGQHSKSFGEITVTNEKGLFKIKGYYKNYYTPYRPENPDERSGGYIKIDGIIVEIRPKYFIFKGLIETGLVERQLSEEEILQRVKFGISRKELENYKVTSTTNKDIDKHLNVCTRPQNRLYKFARERYIDKISYPDYPVYWRFQTPVIPKICDRAWQNKYETVNIFMKKLNP